MLFFIFLFSTSSLLNDVFASVDSVDSICGGDSRVISKVKPIARMMEDAKGPYGCTGTLISRSCMVSAGHCLDSLKVAQFNVPISNKDGKVNYPTAKHQYLVDQIFAARAEGKGADWSVYRLNKNLITGQYAGDVQGFFQIDLSNLDQLSNRELRITGYGASEGIKNYIQQTATGSLMPQSNGSELKYDVDTMQGNSGSAIQLNDSLAIIGIHAYGLCSEDNFNIGTLISASTAFQQAIQQCLASEPKQQQQN